MRLLLAEDDTQLGKTLLKGLRQESYAVDIVADGENAVYQALINEYDVIILDVMMPRRDGFSVCREIRRNGTTTPVLMLTARDTVADKITGLDAGGDDYLTKPFEFAELLGATASPPAPSHRGSAVGGGEGGQSAREHGEPQRRSRGPIDRAHHQGIRVARVSRS